MSRIRIESYPYAHPAFQEPVPVFHVRFGGDLDDDASADAAEKDAEMEGRSQRYLFPLPEPSDPVRFGRFSFEEAVSMVGKHVIARKVLRELEEERGRIADFLFSTVSAVPPDEIGTSRMTVMFDVSRSLSVDLLFTRVRPHERVIQEHEEVWFTVLPVAREARASYARALMPWFRGLDFYRSPLEDVLRMMTASIRRFRSGKKGDRGIVQMNVFSIGSTGRDTEISMFMDELGRIQDILREKKIPDFHEIITDVEARDTVRQLIAYGNEFWEYDLRSWPSHIRVGFYVPVSVTFGHPCGASVIPTDIADADRILAMTVFHHPQRRLLVPGHTRISVRLSRVREKPAARSGLRRRNARSGRTGRRKSGGGTRR